MSKRLKPVQRVCGACLYSKDDSSSMNGLSYVLCSKRKTYMSATSVLLACGDFRFSKQAKEDQERFERQQLQLSVDKRILAKSW